VHAETAGVASEKPVGVARAIYILVYADALEFLYQGNTLREEVHSHLYLSELIFQKYMKNSRQVILF